MSTQTDEMRTLTSFLGEIQVPVPPEPRTWASIQAEQWGVGTEAEWDRISKALPLYDVPCPRCWAAVGEGCKVSARTGWCWARHRVYNGYIAGIIKGRHEALVEAAAEAKRTIEAME